MGIKIEQLLPLLKKGWVAMDKDKSWWWFDEEPTIHENKEFWNYSLCELTKMFDIKPVEDWTQSLMECGE